MRVLLWHGWLLGGSGSNVYTARTAEVLRAAGHDVLVVCQEPHPDRFAFLDAWGRIDAGGVSGLVRAGPSHPSGRATLLRPDIGKVLPVFVWDEYEGFEVKRFVDLNERELETYLSSNVGALRTAVAWHRPEVVVTGHAVPGAVVARRAMAPGGYVAKIHGSDIEYAVRLQPRYLDLAREGLEGARSVIGPSGDALERIVSLVPTIATRTRIVAPGVDVEAFRPLPRREALWRAADLLEGDERTAGGRPAGLDGEVDAALHREDAEALDALAGRYDQNVPDPGASDVLRSLAGHGGPVVGYFGKLIPQKGVHLLLQAVAVASGRPRVMIVGFGLYREWLQGLAAALSRGDVDAVRWLGRSGRVEIGLSDQEVRAASGRPAAHFTGRLDHRYAFAISALDVLVVPSVLDEAFGMVAAEGAAAGALPLVARHSGLAEIARALEEAVDRPGLFSYEPGAGATRRIAAGLDRLLALPRAERADLRTAVSGFVASRWTWERTAEALLAAAG